MKLGEEGVISQPLIVLLQYPLGKPNKGIVRTARMCEKCMSRYECDCLCEFESVRMNNYEYAVNRCPFCGHIERGSIRDRT